MRKTTPDELKNQSPAADSEIVSSRSQFGPQSALDGLVRRRAQQMLRTAVEEEVNVCLLQFADRVDAEGKRLVVRNGYHPTRQLQTGQTANRGH